MLDWQKRQIFESLIKVGLRESSSKLHRDIEVQLSHLAAEGLLSSKVAITRVKDLCIASLQDRFAFVWESLQIVVDKKQIKSPVDASSYLKDELRKTLGPSLDEVNRLLIATFNGPAMINSVPRLDSEWDHLFEKYSNYIDVFMHFDEKKQNDAKSTTIINISNSNVGSVQTGDKSYAEIVQNINVSDKKQIMDALKDVKDYLDKGNNLVNIDRTETIYFIEHISSELEKTEPNVSRLSSFLLPIATGIQTVGSLHGAYIVLKSVLQFLGVSIP